MMTPSQLKEYEFKTAGRNAYKADDVDDFFAEVAANYTKMFHENGELVKRVGLLADRLEKFKKEEEEIKSAVVSAQRAADIIVRDAKNSVADAESEAEAVLAAAKSEAALIKSDAEKQAIADSELLLSMTRDKAQEIIKKAKEEAAEILLEANAAAKEARGAATRTMTSESLLYDMLKKEVAEFKSNILNQYKTHIELISKLPDLAEEEARKQEAVKEETTPTDKSTEAEQPDHIYSFTSDSQPEVTEEASEEVAFVEEQGESETIENNQPVSDDINVFEVQREEVSEESENIFEINANVNMDVADLVEEKIEITVNETEDFSATDFAESEETIASRETTEADERKAALQYFSSENKDEVMEVDEEMLTQDGELVVKTDLPLSFFDDADNLEFVDDFDGMERDEDFGSFSFSSVQTNPNAQRRPSKRVTVDTAYLDFLAAESDAEYGKAEDDDDNDDDDEAPRRGGFFRRK